MTGDVKVELIPDGANWIARVRLADGRMIEAYGPGEEGAMAAMQQKVTELAERGVIKLTDVELPGRN
jgi:hypothetical protein